MHNVVGTVFKVLGLTIIFLALSVLVSTLFDVYTVTSKVTSTAILMQGELAKHNGLPTEEASQTFAKKLCDDVVKNDRSIFVGIESNFGSTDTQTAMNSEGYAGSVSFGQVVSTAPFDKTIEPGHEYEYGDTLHLIIRCYYNPVTMQGSKSTQSFARKVLGTSYIDFKYSVPCLHFNK